MEALVMPEVFFKVFSNSEYEYIHEPNVTYAMIKKGDIVYKTILNYTNILEIHSYVNEFYNIGYNIGMRAKKFATELENMLRQRRGEK